MRQAHIREEILCQVSVSGFAYLIFVTAYLLNKQITKV